MLRALNSHFLHTAGHTGKADGFVEKKGQIFIKIKSGEWCSWRRKFTCAFYHMNLVSLVAFENFASDYYDSSQLSFATIVTLQNITEVKY